MILNLKWCQENQIAKLFIDDNATDFLTLDNDFSNAFNNDFISYLVRKSNNTENLENSSVVLDEKSLEEAPENVKNNFHILREVLKEFVNGLNFQNSD